jgi:ABC-type Fe3+-citrate transport system substrate-binding protein
MTPVKDTPSVFNQAITLESLAALNPDVLIMNPYPVGDTQGLEKLNQSNVWKSLNAVKNNQVYTVGKQYAWTAVSWMPDGRALILNELQNVMK